MQFQLAQQRLEDKLNLIIVGLLSRQPFIFNVEGPELAVFWQSRWKKNFMLSPKTKCFLHFVVIIFWGIEAFLSLGIE